MNKEYAKEYKVAIYDETQYFNDKQEAQCFLAEKWSKDAYDFIQQQLTMFSECKQFSTDEIAQWLIETYATLLEEIKSFKEKGCISIDNFGEVEEVSK